MKFMIYSLNMNMNSLQFAYALIAYIRIGRFSMSCVSLVKWNSITIWKVFVYAWHSRQMKIRNHFFYDCFIFECTVNHRHRTRSYGWRHATVTITHDWFSIDRWINNGKYKQTLRNEMCDFWNESKWIHFQQAAF